MKTARTMHTLWIILAAVLLYAPITGHTLYTDDFSRIADNADLSGDYFATLLTDNRSDGFYRPLNHLSFGLTYRLFGLNSYAYGALNLALLVGTALLLAAIVSDLLDERRAGLLAALLWLSTAKPLAAALTWAVGRTTGLYAFFAMLGIWCVLQVRSRPARWPLAAAVCACAGALLSKESAVVVGPMLLALLWVPLEQRRSVGRRALIAFALGLLAIYGLYFWLRAGSNAMGPDTAPIYYRWDLLPLSLLKSLLKYLERALLVSVLAVPLFYMLTRGQPGAGHAGKHRGIALAGWAAAFLCAIAPMLPVPATSRLYAYFPSLFIAGGIATWCAQSPRWDALRGRRFATLCALVLLVAAGIAYSAGLESHRRHGHTLQWAQTLLDAEPPAGTVVHIVYGPDTFAGSEDADAQFYFLELATRLGGARIHVTHGHAMSVHPPWTFRIARRDRHGFHPLEPVSAEVP